MDLGSDGEIIGIAGTLSVVETAAKRNHRIGILQNKVGAAITVFAIGLALAICPQNNRAQTNSAAEIVLVLPFENTSDHPEYNWIGESFADSLASLLDKPGIIVEGRDITTVVAPDARVRILLTASEQVRIGRRSAELTGESAESTARQLSSRDAQDSKVVDFLNAADGVTTLDSTDLDFPQTVDAVVALVRRAQADTQT